MRFPNFFTFVFEPVLSGRRLYLQRASMQTPDPQLIAQIKERDACAFQQFFERYREQILQRMYAVSSATMRVLTM